MFNPPLEGGSTICFEHSEKEISGRGSQRLPLPENASRFRPSLKGRVVLEIILPPSRLAEDVHVACTLHRERFAKLR